MVNGFFYIYVNSPLPPPPPLKKKEIWYFENLMFKGGQKIPPPPPFPKTKLNQTKQIRTEKVFRQKGKKKKTNPPISPHPHPKSVMSSKYHTYWYKRCLQGDLHPVWPSHPPPPPPPPPLVPNQVNTYIHIYIKHNLPPPPSPQHTYFFSLFLFNIFPLLSYNASNRQSKKKGGKWHTTDQTPGMTL